MERFESCGKLKPLAGGGGQSEVSEEKVQEAKNILEDYKNNKKQISLRKLASTLDMGLATAWKIVRKKFGWYPYKPKTIVPLTDEHKAGRVAFCNWFLDKPKDFEQKVIWSDEKWFVLKQKPNKQNERYWAPCDPGIEVECREQGGKKVMCWAGVVGGKVIIHWFELNKSVNGEVYLEMLKNVVWPKVRGVVARRGLWFQQDGATVHTTVKARQWLNQKFGDRVISRLTDHHPWPAKSPDLSPLDY